MSVSLCWLGHATVRIEIDGVVLLTDPVLGRWLGPLRRADAPPAPAAYADVHAVLISHAHHDHLSLSSLRRLSRDTPVIAPRGLIPVIKRAGLGRITELDADASTRLGPVTVSAVAVEHDGRRLGSSTPTAALGFLIQGTGSVFFAGDTGLFDGLANLRGRVDVAILPTGGWGPRLGAGHMDAHEAAAACALIEPAAALPVHWQTLALPGTRRLLGAIRARQTARRFAAEVERLALGTVALDAPVGTPIDVSWALESGVSG